MKKIFISFLIIISTSIYSQDTIRKSVGDFTTLKVYNGIELDLVKSDKQEVVITGEKSDLVNIKTTRDILKIYLPLPETLANGKVKVVLYYSKNIDVIDSNEGAIITGKDFIQQQVTIKAQEMAFINMVIDVKYLNVKSVTGGVIKLSGTTNDQTIEVNNGGVYRGFNLKSSGTTEINAALGGKGEVLVGETLDATVKFGGTIFYKGKPEVFKNKKVLGGTIEEKN